MKHIIRLLFIVSVSYGQKQGNVWVFGQGGALNFNSGSPTAFTGSQVFGNPTLPGDYLYSEGCTSISDSSGNLLFYSNGEKVWNKLNQVMPNGSGLNGFYSSTNAAFTIPVPSSDSLYYLFTTDGLERYLQKGLRYSIINMCLDNGKGDVISSQKNILLLDTVSEKLCAVAHPNGRDIWLITHKFFSDAFYTYLITPSGINPPVISYIGSTHIGNMSFYNGCGGAIGQMKASPNGNRIGLAFANASPEVVEVFSFNSLTGVLSNSISLTKSPGNYGVEFSPDNTKFYLTSTNGIFQFDLTAGGGTEAAINASKTLITNLVCIPGPLQLGPNGKIYVSRCNNTLGLINLPNNLGTACGFIANAININPCVYNTSLPSFIAGYNYTNKQKPLCLTSNVKENKLLNEFKLYPNPTNNSATLEFNNVNNETCSVILYDFKGKVLRTINQIATNKILIEKQNLTPGLYFFQLYFGRQLHSIGKLSIK